MSDSPVWKCSFTGGIAVMKERVSDYENKKTEERTKIRLFSPLTAIRYPRYDWEDLNGEGEELLPAELCS